MTENPVRSSARFVMRHAEHVSLNNARLEEIAAGLKEVDFISASFPPEMHLETKDERAMLDYLILLDTIQFCFWHATKPRWQITRAGRTHQGYFALALSLKDFFERAPERASWHAFAEMPFSAFRAMLHGAENLLFTKKRWELARGVARVMMKKYRGDSRRLIASANRKCAVLVPKIVRELPGFNDEAVYKGKNMKLWKRAQILAGDIWGALKGKGLGAFDDIGYLTAFADYKLPQILRHWNVFEYAPSLERRIASRRLIAPGSAAEIEIRAATICAVEAFREMLAARGIVKTSVEIDWYLWNKSKSETLPNPYHLTKTIYY